MNLTEAELGYIAGIVDGEGSVCITRDHGRHGKKRAYYCLRLSVANTNKELIEWLKSVTGGHMNPRPYYVGRTEAWQWVVSGDNAVYWLERLMPYLRIKRVRAEIGMNFQKNKARRNRRERTIEEEALEEAKWILMHNINQGSEVR